MSTDSQPGAKVESLATLRELSDAATPGPWLWGDLPEPLWRALWNEDPDRPAIHDEACQPSTRSIYSDEHIVVEAWANHAEDEGLAIHDRDAAFIVAAANYVRALLGADSMAVKMAVRPEDGTSA